MSRKKISNKEKFVFKEDEFVKPLENRDISKRPSVQKRLFPKAELNKPFFKPPIQSPLSPPYTPITGCGDGNWRGLNSSIKPPKKDPATDPCVEEVVAKLARLNNEIFLNESLQKSDPTTSSPLSPSSNTKRVLLKDIPESNKQEVFDAFKAYHQNSVLNMNKAREMFFTDSKSMDKTEPKESRQCTDKPRTWQSPVMFSRDPPLSPPPSPNAVEEKLDGLDSCICMRPLKLILCPICSHTTPGRLRKSCQVHPNDIYLLDIEACPRCKETNKFILKEYDLPDGFAEVFNKLVTKK